MTDSPKTSPASPAFIATDQDGEGIAPLGNSGWLTATIAGTAYRLRSPLFGELKRLRLALEAVTDEIDKANEVTQRIAADIIEHGKALAGRNDDEHTPAEKRKTAKLTTDARKAGRDLVNLADDRRMGWWALVFDTLSIDGAPEDWPSWVVDYNLPAQVMNHWRSVPLAPGR
jgi:hypothetical protein